jgi:protein TonB
LSVVPEHISRGGKIGENLGAIFNLSELDRAPTPVLQPAPIPPRGLEKDLETQNVRVEFIVTADGRVVNVFATASTDRRFEDAAVNGVGKWKFKPGMKGGRKVNVRMAVPIVFHAVHEVR